MQLFHLARIFERELKAFLDEAKRKDIFPVTRRDLQQLSAMIDCATSNKVIKSDKELHFLRQERDERAHGEVPSLEERKDLMRHAPFLGDLYIKYISIFNQERKKLDNSIPEHC